jgi:hypothetical protein
VSLLLHVASYSSRVTLSLHFTQATTTPPPTMKRSTCVAVSCCRCVGFQTLTLLLQGQVWQEPVQGCNVTVVGQQELLQGSWCQREWCFGRCIVDVGCCSFVRVQKGGFTTRKGGYQLVGLKMPNLEVTHTHTHTHTHTSPSLTHPLVGSFHCGLPPQTVRCTQHP